jgi:hypothetical protein
MNNMSDIKDYLTKTKSGKAIIATFCVFLWCISLIAFPIFIFVSLAALAFILVYTMAYAFFDMTD